MGGPIIGMSCVRVSFVAEIGYNFTKGIACL